MSNAYNVTDTLQATVDDLRSRLVAAEVKLEVLIDERSFKKQFWARLRRELRDIGLFVIGVIVVSVLIAKLHILH